MARRSIYTPKGAVQANRHGLYIDRPADKQLAELCLNHDFAYVLTARQMGKSSLMFNTVESLRKAETSEDQLPFRTVTIDLTQIGTFKLDVDAWYLGLLTLVARQLRLPVNTKAWWEEQKNVRSLTVTQRLILFFQDIVLEHVKDSLIVFIDEIETTLTLDFTDDFFIAIRSFFDGRVSEPKFRRLSFVLIGVATPSELIRDPRRTPFNIGQRVELSDFTYEDALPLAAGLGLSEPESHKVLNYILSWTGGHPYLTQRLCIEVANANRSSWAEQDIELLVDQAFLGRQSDQDEHFRFVRDRLINPPAPTKAIEMLGTYRAVRRERQAVSDEEQSSVKAQLKLAGIVKREGNYLQVRNPIYWKVFDAKWIREHWPENIWQRLKPALPLIAVSFVVAGVMTALAAVAFNQAQAARNAENRAEAAREEALNAQEEAEARALEADAARREAERERDRAEGERSRADKAQKVAESEQERAEGERNRAENALVAEEEQRLRAEEQTAVARQQTLRAEKQTTLAEERAFTIQERALISEIEARAGEARSLLDIDPTRGLITAVYTAGLNLDNRSQVPEIMDPVHASLLDSARTARETNRLFGHEARITSVISNSTGTQWVSASWDGTLRRWYETGGADEIEYPNEAGKASSLAVGGINKQTLLAGWSSGVLTFYNLSDGSSIAKRAYPSSGQRSIVAGVWSVAASSEKPLYASGTVFGHIRVWEQTDTDINLISDFRVENCENGCRVHGIAIHPETDEIIAGTSDGLMRVWNTEGQLLHVSDKIHRTSISSISANHQGIISAASDGQICTWSVLLESLGCTQANTRINSVALNPKDGSFAAGGDDGIVYVWNNRGRLLSKFRGHQDSVHSLTFSGDGDRIISGSDDLTVRVWDYQKNPTEIVIEAAHNESIWSVEFHPTRQLFASASSDGVVKLWNQLDSSLNRSIALGENSRPWPVYLAFSPDGNVLATGNDADVSVRYWDLQGREIYTSIGGEDVMRDIAFSPSSSLLAFGTVNVYLTNYKSGEFLYDLSHGGAFTQHDFFIPEGQLESGWATALDFTNDGKILASGDLDGSLKLWNIDLALDDDNSTEELISDFKAHDYGTINSIDFSLENLLVSAGEDRTIRLWDSSGNSLGEPIRGHEGIVYSAQFTPNGQRLVSGGQDGTVRLWDLEGEPIGQPFEGHSGRVLSLAVSPDGNWIASGGVDRTLRLWRLGDWQDWLEIACNRLENHVVLNSSESSFDPTIVQGAKNTCQQYIWNEKTAYVDRDI